MKMKMRTVVCALLAVLALFVLSACEDKKDESEEISVYDDGDQNIKFYDDNTFAASLSHGAVKNGTYSESTDSDNVKTVIYTVEGEENVTGTIKDGVLTIPEEWTDGHGHGDTLTLKSTEESNEESNEE